jgi:Potential Queuosine, Q, salvage protein family
MCAWVAERARHVRIERELLEEYAAGLPASGGEQALDPETHFLAGDREQRAAFIICLDAINFGSGWWPTIRKQEGRSGYFTVAAGLTARFRERGGLDAVGLAELAPAEVAEMLGQEPSHPLMSDYAEALRDVGRHVLADHRGSFASVLESAGDSAVALAEILSRWSSFADTSRYEARDVPFFKRAQIAAADVHLAGLADLRDRDRLTAFADNLVPHVLRVDGVLVLDERLRGAIESGELIEHGSAQEVELRACAVHAVELLADARGRAAAPAEIDQALWNRGRAPRYKSLPRPRSRTTAY